MLEAYGSVLLVHCFGFVYGLIPPSDTLLNVVVAKHRTDARAYRPIRLSYTIMYNTESSYNLVTRNGTRSQYALVRMETVALRLPLSSVSFLLQDLQLIAV